MPTSLRLARFAGFCLALGAAQGGCSSKPTVLSDSALGISIVEDVPVTTTRDPSGAEEYVDSQTVGIDAVDHPVSLDEKLQSTAAGGRTTLSVVDKVMGQTVLFSYDPSTSSITFSDGTTTNTVVQNPDKSYTVDGQAAQNGKAALVLLKTSPVYQSASAWSMIATYARCQTCLENAASRTSTNCNGSGVGNATPPAVCDLFRDLCDCIECDKAGKTPCAKCS